MQAARALDASFILPSLRGGFAGSRVPSVAALSTLRYSYRRRSEGGKRPSTYGLPIGLSASALAFVALSSRSSCDMEAETPPDLPEYWMEKQGEHAWLEDVLGDRALEWVREENGKTMQQLGDPAESPLYSRVLKILTSPEKIPHVRKIGSHYYNFWKDKSNPRGLWRRCSLDSYERGLLGETDWETVLDLDALGREEGVSWVYKGADVCYNDGTTGTDPTRVLLMLSRGGADATVVREFNLASKQFVPPESGGFYIPEAKSRVSWRDKDTLVVGTDVDSARAGGASTSSSSSMTDSGYPRCVHEWHRGTPLREATLTFEGAKSDVSVSGYLTRHRRHVLEWRSRSLDFYTSEYQVRVCDGDGRPLNSSGGGGGGWVSLSPLLPGNARVSMFADQLVIQLKSDWRGHPSGSLVSCPTAAVLRAAAQAHDARSDSNYSTATTEEPLPLQVLFQPSPTASLAGWTRTKNYLLVSTLDNVRSRIVFWKYRERELQAMTTDDKGSPEQPTTTTATVGTFEHAGEEAAAAIRGASLRAVDDDESDAFFWTTSSYTQPSTLALADASEGPAGLQLQLPGPTSGQSGGTQPKSKPSGARVLRRLPDQFDARHLAVTQGEATSKDGTKIPYFLVAPETGEGGGPMPTLLYGYGGFQISLTPGYAATIGAGWLEAGGAWVVANIRGGGEFGPKWHQAALQKNRHLAYEDFVAVAEHLVSRGVTTPAQLACRGGSNGGLLVGNMLTRRPDLFGAVVCAVPLLDMKRFNHLLAGASWMAEYGNPDTADWDAFMKRFSSYHNIDPSVRYPPLLMTTSTRDDRVHPYHARAFVKRLQDTGKNPAEHLHYYENIEGGHGGAADAKQQAFMTALYLEFLKSTIGKSLVSQPEK